MNADFIAHVSLFEGGVTRQPCALSFVVGTYSTFFATTQILCFSVQLLIEAERSKKKMELTNAMLLLALPEKVEPYGLRGRSSFAAFLVSFVHTVRIGTAQEVGTAPKFSAVLFFGHVKFMDVSLLSELLEIC